MLCTTSTCSLVQASKERCVCRAEICKIAMMLQLLLFCLALAHLQGADTRDLQQYACGAVASACGGGIGSRDGGTPGREVAFTECQYMSQGPCSGYSTCSGHTRVETEVGDDWGGSPCVETCCKIIDYVLLHCTQFCAYIDRSGTTRSPPEATSTSATSSAFP